VLYDILCHFGNSSNDTSHEQDYNYYHPNLHFSNAFLTKFGIFSILTFL
jgi:hypothetical protein